MAEFLKPDNLNVVWASGGDRLFPGNTKYAAGWGVEIPPRQYFNEIDYKQDQMLAHLNQHGVVVWDASTEYQANKSYVQGSTGTIFQCVLTHTNQDPELDLSDTYWRIAFANAGDFYTKTEGDARYAQLSNNGNDFVAATFRTNLSLYSKTETYSQTEVNARTTVASTAQSQSQTSNTVLLSPLRLGEALKGANQQLTTTGFQKLPGGLIVQWGIGVTNASGLLVVTLPVPYPTAQLISLSGSREDSGGVGTQSYSTTPTSLTIRSFNTNTGSALATSPITWFSVGF